ncbi:hypothetical protein OG735_26345 [Streptomyces sp. NBC_01210]|uniref:hypothetical protein n=1 Tax=Streptomyces sp. NBC_01210 TaxID=2903774 RepID=UPI002E0E601B|nr:hypothetical protein OG735_26345 [Streptomyces sp. NBC_01210]
MSAPVIGETVRDTQRNRVGVVMDHVGPRYQLRAVKGGKEWEAEEANLSPAMQSDALSEDVAKANSVSRQVI